MRPVTRPCQHPFGLGIALSGGLCLPRAFRLPAFASWPSYPARASAQPCGKPTATGRPYRGFHVPHRQAASGELTSRRRALGTVSAGPQTPTDHCSTQDASTTFVPLCVTTLHPRLHGHSTRLPRFLAEIAAVAADCRWAFPACWRPRDDSRRPGRREMCFRC